MIRWKEQVRCFEDFITTRRDHEPFCVMPGLDVISAEIISYRSAYPHPFDVLAINRISNGQGEESIPLLREEFWLVPLKKTVECMQIFGEKIYPFECGEPRVRNVSWSRNWFTFAVDGFGEMLVVDMDPGPDGVVGQVLKVWHDDNRVEVMAHSLCELLKRYGREVGEGWTP